MAPAVICRGHLLQILTRPAGCCGIYIHKVANIFDDVIMEECFSPVVFQNSKLDECTHTFYQSEELDLKSDLLCGGRKHFIFPSLV